MSAAKKVLVLDDESDIGEIVCATLTGAGYLCRAFTQVAEFLAALPGENPQLIICDISMPGMDGLELRNLLLQNHLLSNCGFIFLTARSDTQYRTRAWQAQADAYLTKPFAREELVAIANNVCAKQISKADTMDKDHIYIADGSGASRVPLADILYITVTGDYTELHTERGNKRTLTTLAKLQQSLPATGFIRVHKSFIVNAAKIDRLTRNQIWLVDKSEIPVGDKYRINLDAMLASFRNEGD